MPSLGFVVEGPRPCKSFVLRFHTLIELLKRNLSIGFCSNIVKAFCLLCFLHDQGQKSEQKYRTKSFALTSYSHGRNELLAV